MSLPTANRPNRPSFRTLLIACSLALSTAQSATAIPAPPRSQIFEQPDARTFEGLLRGDEHLSWVETVAGSAVAKGDDGFWYYVRRYQGRTPQLSQRRADRPDPRPDPEGQGNGGTIPAVPGESVPFDDASLRPGARSPKVLFILVDYADAPATFTDESEWADKIIDAADPSDKSIVDYYDQASFGKVTLAPAEETDGIEDNGVVGWLRLAGNHPNPAQFANGTPQSIDAMKAIYEAAIEKADEHVNYAQFDENTDGGISPDELAIVVVASGYDFTSNAAAAFSVWPQQPDTGAIRWYDGVGVDGEYAIVGEIQQESGVDFTSRIGVLVHELGHLIFGLPDLYDTDGNSKGISAFGVMGGGSDGFDPLADSYHGETPVLPSAWTLYKLDWVDAHNPLFLTLGSTASQSTTQPQLGIAHPYDQALNACPTREYFLIQYRTNEGYDRGLNAPLDLYSGDFSPGVLIFHIDESVSNNENNTRRLVDVEEADDYSLDQFTATEDTLWAVGNATRFDGTSSPNSDFNDDWGLSQPSGVSIEVGAQGADAFGEDRVFVTISSPCDHQLVMGTNPPSLSLFP